MSNLSDNDTSGSDSDENCEQKINELVEKARSNIIPVNSKKLYEQQYEKFEEWCKNMKKQEIDEKIVLAYFEKLSETYKATSLWATYTKIKSMLILKKNINISGFLELQCFLKNKSKHHKVLKSKVFTSEEISTFLKHAPDEQFLLHKVALIFGIHGCLRKKELLNININDVQQQGLLYHVKISTTKTGVSKSFITSEEMHPTISKYIGLRPEGISKFFVQYRNQKCTRQHAGKGKIGSIPQEVAKYLNLPDAERYTGHAYRRTSATLLADEGADLITLKRHGAWKSSTVAEDYINDSLKNKKDTSCLISSAITNFKKPKLVPKYIKPSTKTSETYYDGPSTSRLNLTAEERKDIENISQEQWTQATSSELEFFAKDVTKITGLEDVTKSELEEVVSTQFVVDKNNSKKPIVVLKNCSNFTINF